MAYASGSMPWLVEVVELTPLCSNPLVSVPSLHGSNTVDEFLFVSRKFRSQSFSDLLDILSVEIEEGEEILEGSLGEERDFGDCLLTLRFRGPSLLKRAWEGLPKRQGSCLGLGVGLTPLFPLEDGTGWDYGPKDGPE
ncbi:hypothetical protein Ancab_002404 [Ancistrocladus abbreviatus]